MMNLYCNKDLLETIKKNKVEFIENLIGLNIPYDVCFLISGAMNKAILEVESKQPQP